MFRAPVVSEQETLDVLALNGQLAIQEVGRNLGFRPSDSDGCALSLYYMAIRSEGGFPNIIVNHSGKRLQSNTCPTNFSILFGRWANLVPAIQQLSQQHKYDLQQAICRRLPPFPQTHYETNPFFPSFTSPVGVHGIACCLTQLANDINDWRYRDRQVYHTHTLPSYNMNFPTSTLPPPIHSWTLQSGPAASLQHPSPHPPLNLHISYPHSASPPNVLSESPSNEAFALGVGGFNVTPHTPTFPLPSHSGAGTAQTLGFPSPQPSGIPSLPFMDHQYQYLYDAAPPSSYQAPNLQIPVASSLGDRTPTRSPFPASPVFGPEGIAPLRSSFGPNNAESRCYSPTDTSDATAELIAAVISSRMSISDIISELGQHGCRNISDQLDQGACDVAPRSGGGFSNIFFGKLYDGTPVAIKTIFRSGSNDEERKHLKRTARELHTWSKCDHPHIAPLLGLAGFRGQIAMLSRWTNNGHVRAYVKKTPSADRLALCIEVGAALAYLHHNQVVHGDLKGPNVLVSDEGHAMLIDFGNAILGDSTLQFTATATNSSMTLRWTAPEMFDDSKHTKEGDVYSFGMTVLETFTGDEPYPDKKEKAAIYAIVHSQVPDRPAEIPVDGGWYDELWQLLLRCWCQDPAKRPTASQVYEELQNIQRSRQ